MALLNACKFAKNGGGAKTSDARHSREVQRFLVLVFDLRDIALRFKVGEYHPFFH